MEKLIIPDSFFSEEEKYGFLISKEIKHLWAIELDLLQEFVRVCEKYNLRYYAIGGTLLGAIRHKGFIPWDDDIDVAMPRKDYKKLQQVAKIEFRDPYFFQDEYTDPGALFGYAKIRNNNTTIISPGYLDPKHGNVSINQGIFIDIFPLDNMPDGKMERDAWIAEIKKIAQKAWSIRKYSHRHIPLHDEMLENELANLSKLGSPNYWFEQYDTVLSRYSEEKTSETCLYCVYSRYGERFCYNLSDFEDTVKVPFEMTEIVAPSNYDSVLTKSFGNWGEMKQIGSLHSGVNESFIDFRKPWTYYVDSETGIKRDLILSLLKK